MFLTPAPGEYTAKAPLVGAFAISPAPARRIKSPRKKAKEKNTHFPLNLHLMFCALLTQSNPVTGDKTNPGFRPFNGKNGKHHNKIRGETLV